MQCSTARSNSRKAIGSITAQSKRLQASNQQVAGRPQN
jgi:hypothetical protein